MNAFGRAMAAEATKLRGTLALWMCVIAPSTVAALLVLQILLSSNARDSSAAPMDIWTGYALGTTQLWAYLMLPLFITLQSALLAGLEHGNQQWKHLLALPVPKSVHYLAKTSAMVAMLALAMLVLFALIPIGGWVLATLDPALASGGAPPWGLMLRSLSGCFAAAMLVTAVHTWAALRWRSFTVAVSIGMTATVIGFLAMQSDRYGPYFPWSMPAHATMRDASHIGFVVITGLAGGVLVTLAGLWDFVRRDVD